MINRFSREYPDVCTLSEAREFTSQTLYDIFGNCPPPINDVMNHFSSAMGKNARAALLLTYAADNELNVPGAAVFAASAIELFHLATLVHDDIIDDAPTRRGIESAQSKFGKKSAVIIGDYLLCLAMSAALKAYESTKDKPTELDPSFKKYLPLLTRICEGEFNQLRNASNLELAPRTYLKIISGKTAELFRISAMTGAGFIPQERNETELSKAGRFGWYVGMVFQIIDDCKDYQLDTANAQKPVRHDLPQGVITLPIIMALLRTPELISDVKDVLYSHKRVEDISDAIQQSGGVEAAKSIAGRYAKKAAKLLDGGYTGKKREMLELILNKALVASGSF
ncbi:MAG: polyprenyl synthetase family protein [Clostridiales bacterium]|jgi:heptaprenyl diphosphate synthase|nr:polyprenyl synthetase family protein [Clostridiales bacterium]